MLGIFGLLHNIFMVLRKVWDKNPTTLDSSTLYMKLLNCSKTKLFEPWEKFVALYMQSWI